MTVHATGLSALLLILELCVIACTPVWVATWYLSRWAQRRIERAFRRRLADLGCSSEEIDEAWREVMHDSGAA